MGVLQIGAVGLLLAITAVLLRDLGWRGAAVFSAFSLVVLLSLCTEGLLALTGALAALAKNATLTEAAEGVLKITGVGLRRIFAASLAKMGSREALPWRGE